MWADFIDTFISTVPSLCESLEGNGIFMIIQKGITPEITETFLNFQYNPKIMKQRK